MLSFLSANRYHTFLPGRLGAAEGWVRTVERPICRGLVYLWGSQSPRGICELRMLHWDSDTKRSVLSGTLLCELSAVLHMLLRSMW